MPLSAALGALVAWLSTVDGGATQCATCSAHQKAATEIGASTPSMPAWVQAGGVSASPGFTTAHKVKWDVPDLVRYIAVPSIEVTQGIPVRFNTAVSKADVATLQQYYLRKFIEAHLYIPPPGETLEFGEGAAQVNGLDPETLVSYVVILRPLDEKETTVIMAEALMGPWVAAVRNPTPLGTLPALPGAQQPIRSSVEGTELLQFSCAESESQVLDFYQSVLKGSGYLPQGSGLFSNGNSQVSVSTQRRKDQTQVLVRRSAHLDPLTPDSPQH